MLGSLKLALLCFLTMTSTVNAVTIRFHSLNHCKTSPVDPQCGNIPAKNCCSKKGLQAGSVAFSGIKGRGYHVTKGSGTANCNNDIYHKKAANKNICVYHVNGDLTYHGAFWTNPLSKMDLVGGDGCHAPNQAVVHGETTFDIANMSSDQVSELYKLAENGTAMDAFPAGLKDFILPGVDDMNIDMAYVASDA